LHKNGYFKITEITISKKIDIKYYMNDSIIALKGIAYKYVFPFIYLKNKNDSFVIDVRTIEEINCKSSFFYMKCFGVFLTGSISILVLTASLKRPNISSSLEFLGGSLIPITFSYLLYNDAFKKYNTKTDWSFYQ
jgi:hypothetical protein